MAERADVLVVGGGVVGVCTAFSLVERGIRVTLDHPEIYLAQVRAMMKASEGLDNLRIMLPMITSITEVEEAMSLVERAYQEVLEEGVDHRVRRFVGRVIRPVGHSHAMGKSQQTVDIDRVIQRGPSPRRVFAHSVTQ